MKRDRDDGEAEKRKKKKRKKDKQRDKESKSGLKLLLYAALGETKKVVKLLDSSTPPDVHTYDGEGNTPLHQAARFGHVEIVELLLDAGGDPRAEDVRGNTPAHIAAAKGHLSVVTSILKGRGAPDVDLPNGEGRTIRQLVDTAMGRQDTIAMARTQAAREEPHPSESPGPGSEWEAKMQREAQVENGFDDQGWDSYDAADEEYFGAGPFGVRSGPAMTEDAYARFIWEEMSRRGARRAPGVGPVIAEHWAETTRLTSERQRKAQAAEDARQRSRKILEEERAKDAAWREAVLRGDVGARRAAYEAKWHVFASAGAAGAPVRFADVPWLVDEVEDARAVILYGTAGPEEERRRVRTELMRWHPDKFVAKFGNRLVAGERDRVLDKVKHISQMLTSISIG